MPALFVGVMYGLWLTIFLAQGHNIRDLIRIEARSIHFSSASPALHFDPHYRYEPAGRGYDGADFYFIAVDPLRARYYLLSPAYRYTRIVYPMMARLAARGSVAAIPYAMVLINVIAMTFSTLLLSAYLFRRRLSPWLALLFGFYGGLFIAVTRDLAEPLAFAFVLLGIVLLESKTRWTFVLAGLAFGLAALSRETTAVFPLVYACVWSLTGAVTRGTGNPSGYSFLDSAALVGLSVGPLVAYRVFLLAWLGTHDASSTSLLPELVPFGGLLVYFPWNASRVQEIVFVVIPALICGVMALRSCRLGWQNPLLWAVLVNVLLFVVLLNASSYWNYTASGRITAGVVLCALLCIPEFDAACRGKRGWLWVCGAIWVFLTPVLYVIYLATDSLY